MNKRAAAVRLGVAILFLEGANLACSLSGPEARADIIPTMHPTTFIATQAIIWGCGDGTDQAEQMIAARGFRLPDGKTADDRRAALDANCIKQMNSHAVSPLTGELDGPSDDATHPSGVSVAGLYAGEQGASQGWYPRWFAGTVAELDRESVAKARDKIRSQFPTPPAPNPHGYRNDRTMQTNTQARLNPSPTKGFRRG